MDKKEYTETVRPDGTIVRTYNSGKAFLRERFKRDMDFAEQELRRSFETIYKEVDKLKRESKRVKTKRGEIKLMLRIDSSLATINLLIKNDPLLRQYVSDTKIDANLLREFGNGTKVIEIMRERANLMLEGFKKDLEELNENLMSRYFEE